MDSPSDPPGAERQAAVFTLTSSACEQKSEIVMAAIRKMNWGEPSLAVGLLQCRPSGTPLHSILPGTAMPDFHISPLRGWAVVSQRHLEIAHSESRFLCAYLF